MDVDGEHVRFWQYQRQYRAPSKRRRADLWQPFSELASQFYNPFANTWTATKGQNSGAISSGPLALLGTGKVLLAGGSLKYGGSTTNCLLYDPSTNTWLFTGSLKKVASHTLTRLLNGQVLAVGGTDAELYTP